MESSERMLTSEGLAVVFPKIKNRFREREREIGTTPSLPAVELYSLHFGPRTAIAAPSLANSRHLCGKEALTDLAGAFEPREMMKSIII